MPPACMGCWCSITSVQAYSAVSCRHTVQCRTACSLAVSGSTAFDGMLFNPHVWICCRPCCSEKIVEPSSGLLVCPISGTCSARFLTCAEEDEEEGDRDPEKEHREEDFGGERGEWWN